MVASDSENMSSLKNYLILSNDHMKSMVASFIYKNVNLKKSEYANIEKFINNIDKWSIDTPQLPVWTTRTGFTFVQSIKNSVNDICKTIPTIILNNKSGINGGGILNTGGVPYERCARFISSYYAEFSVYKKTNLANVLDKIYNKTRYPVVFSLQDVRRPRGLMYWLFYEYIADERSRQLTHKKEIIIKQSGREKQGRFNSTRRRWCGSDVTN
jgi:hypothetical protein